MTFIPANTKKANYEFTDRAGRVATMGIWVDNGETDPAAGGVEDLRAKLQAASDAAIKVVSLFSYAVEDTDPVYGTDAFDRPTDKCKLVFLDDENGNTEVQIPSFTAAGYQADGTTPLTSGLPDAVMDAIIANCVSADGNPLTLLVHARRMVPQGLVSWTKK
ncbi:MAG: hypothetical protein H7Z74_13080 [Anaerolineae bacterium]|nr:hypothetical protein [Gemmatimonadaceae bacterium]